jgi:sterol 14alpha-demethylase
MRKVKNPLPIKGTNWIIPTSHTLLASTGVTSQSSEYFKDPSKWDPHRWDNKVDMEDDETIDYGYGNVSKGTKSPYLPFGAGRHRCIGEQFAYLNIGVIVAVMVRELVFTNLHGEQGVVGTDYSVCLEPRLRSK